MPGPLVVVGVLGALPKYQYTPRPFWGPDRSMVPQPSEVRILPPPWECCFGPGCSPVGHTLSAWVLPESSHQLWLPPQPQLICCLGQNAPSFRSCRTGTRWPVSATHKPHFQHNLVEGGVGSLSQKPVQLDWQPRVDVLALGLLARTFWSYWGMSASMIAPPALPGPGRQNCPTVDQKRALGETHLWHYLHRMPSISTIFPNLQCVPAWSDCV